MKNRESQENRLEKTEMPKYGDLGAFPQGFVFISHDASIILVSSKHILVVCKYILLSIIASCKMVPFGIGNL